jgi:serine/threonine protein kinase
MSDGIDLSPFGINFVLTDKNQAEIDSFDLMSPKISDCKIVKDYMSPKMNLKILNSMDSAELYETDTILGEGSFGKVYSIDKNPKSVLKLIQISNDDSFLQIIKEVIIQIIIFKETKDLAYGPYCGEIKKILKEVKYGKIVSLVIEMEKLTVPLDKKINSLKKALNDSFIPDFFTRFIQMHNWLRLNLKYNHRDCKTDNLMLKENSYGTYELKFIDFGFTCINYNGISLSSDPARIYSSSSKCDLKTRDLSMLLYNIYKWNGHVLSNELRDILKTYLNFEFTPKIQCELDGNCNFKTPVKANASETWLALYDFFDKMGTNSKLVDTSDFLRDLKTIKDKAMLTSDIINALSYPSIGKISFAKRRIDEYKLKKETILINLKECANNINDAKNQERDAQLIKIRETDKIEELTKLFKELESGKIFHHEAKRYVLESEARTDVVKPIVRIAERSVTMAGGSVVNDSKYYKKYLKYKNKYLKIKK